MKKIIIGLSVLFVLICSLLIVLTIIYNKKNVLKEEVLTIKRAYFYTKDKNPTFYLYSNTDDTFLYEYKDLETYLEGDDETVIRVDVEDVKNTNMVSYKDKIYYEYGISIKVNANDINIDNCTLKMSTDENNFVIKVGSLNYYDFRMYNELDGIESLYGLSFRDPFLSVGAVYLRLNSQDVEVGKAYIPGQNELNILNIKEEKKDAISVSEYLDYHYNEKEEVSEQEKNNQMLLLIDYRNDVLLDTFPLYLEIGNDYFYINAFSFLRSNDLDSVSYLVSSGEFDGI